MTQHKTDGPFYLGIDLGGTNIKAGVVNDQGKSLSKVSIPTQADRGPEHGLKRMYEAGEKAIRESSLSREEIRGIGLATPGTMDIPRGMLLNPPNLPGWLNVPIRQKIQEHFDLPTVLQNDANAAAYGEYWIGAAQKAHSLVMWTLGTGLGCGIIYADMVIEGEHSHGSECGHMIIEMENGRLCGTGQYGTLEAYASATALIDRCEEALEAGKKTILRKWIDEGRELTPILMGEAANQGDALAEELIMDTAKFLGVGTTSVMHCINPTMFLIGGAMTFGRNETELGRRFLQRVKQEVNKRAFPVPASHTLIDYATLGGDAGYIGAAGCARRAMNLKQQGT